MKTFLKLLLLSQIILCNITKADDAFLSYGLGMFESAVYSAVEVKVFDIGYRKTLSPGVFWNFEGGAWLDASGDPKRSSSMFISSGPGFMVDLNGVEIRNSYGIAWISSTDSYLGGNFPQFHGDFYIGIRDQNGNGMGFKVSHFSSAEIYEPNIGRDSLLLELSRRL